MAHGCQTLQGGSPLVVNGVITRSHPRKWPYKQVTGVKTPTSGVTWWVFLLVGFLPILGKTVRETQFQTSHPCASLARRSGQRSNLEKPIRRMAQIKKTPWRHWKKSSLRCSTARCSIKQIHLYFLTKNKKIPILEAKKKVKHWKARLTTTPYFSIIDICEYMIKFQKCKF